jgi:hypothetical protein
MPSCHALRAALPVAATALALAGAAGALASAAEAGASPDKARTSQPLVVRGQDTVSETGPCPNGVCTLKLTDGAFRGAPVGSGAYTGTIKLVVKDAFPNGEGGLCAPIRGNLELGAGTPNQLVLGFDGESCQDGKGPVTAASFTGLARFRVHHGTGVYAGATGGGLATFAEDAEDHEQITLIGRIHR